MARCSKPHQTRACLLTEDKNCMIKVKPLQSFESVKFAVFESTDRKKSAEPFSLVGSVQDLQTGSHWFEPLAWQIFFLRINDSHCESIHSFLTAAHGFDNSFDGKQPVVWKEILYGVLIKRSPGKHG